MGPKHYNTDGRGVWTARGTMTKEINPTCPHSMRVSWSAYDLFCQPPDLIQEGKFLGPKPGVSNTWPENCFSMAE